ncbi:MAG: hypothetical protein ABL889_16295, partial [Terricaulis sp.]
MARRTSLGDKTTGFAQRISIAARISLVERYAHERRRRAHHFKYKIRNVAFFALTLPRTAIIHPPLRSRSFVREETRKNDEKQLRIHPAGADHAQPIG